MTVIEEQFKIYTFLINRFKYRGFHVEWSYLNNTSNSKVIFWFDLYNHVKILLFYITKIKVLICIN